MDETLCQEVLDSTLSENQKLDLLATMIEDVEQWNSQYAVSSPPVGVHSQNSGMVRDGWVKIMSILPSVEASRLITDKQGKVVAKGWYRLEPSTEKERGDCRTVYRATSNSYIELYLNGEYLRGNTFKTNATTLHFSAHLVIDIVLDVTHYHRIKDDDKKWLCVEDYSEVRRSREVLSDSLTAYRQNIAPQFSFRVSDPYFDFHDVTFDSQPVPWHRIQFNSNDFYEKQSENIEPFFTLEPYYVLLYRPVPDENVDFSGIRFANETFQVGDLRGCKITFGGYFEEATVPCPRNESLNISVDEYVPPSELELRYVSVFLKLVVLFAVFFIIFRVMKRGANDLQYL